MKYIYPAVLEKEKNDESWINVTIPDIFGGVTCGKDGDEAIFMAKDLVKTMLINAPAQCLPPKSLEETKNNFPNSKVVAIEVEI